MLPNDETEDLIVFHGWRFSAKLFVRRSYKPFETNAAGDFRPHLMIPEERGYWIDGSTVSICMKRGP